MQVSSPLARVHPCAFRLLVVNVANGRGGEEFIEGLQGNVEVSCKVKVSIKEDVVSRMCQRFWEQLEKEEEDSWEIRIRMTLQLCRQHS